MARASSSIFVHINKRKLWVSLPFQVFVVAIALLCLCFVPINASASARQYPPRQHHLTQKPTFKLRFRRNGEFKILQVADMHYANAERRRARMCCLVRFKVALTSTLPLLSTA
ncbi:hypothetical protein F3Y22_tig00110467pilonHSYRG00147 [Hibiscus syriacus]|uniref:Uncharacterized protein n=1 Tax=Hibiscus syriacus TaxID=106335 RepID=A0A6A3AHU9_HIBSY|nr:hypothetical protein F3Y22_tig00110467pilonHSYRG00147 [Hibiscus syriacus]